jgi:hypothetical protein
MFSIHKSPIPPSSLLNTYTSSGTYTDAYSTESIEQISLPAFIFAFYTTPLFGLERFILSKTIAKPSTDSQARQLADGQTASFAAWQVEGRREDEILLCDISGRTRSWLMVIPIVHDRVVGTRLYFGSAVVPVKSVKTGKPSLGPVFAGLLRFHQMYSVLLLYSAKLRIKQISRVKMRNEGVY